MRCIPLLHRSLVALRRWHLLGLISGMLLASGPAAVAGPYIRNWTILGQQTQGDTLRFVATQYEVAILAEWQKSAGIYQAQLLKSYNPDIVVLGYANVRGLLPGQANWPIVEGLHDGVQTTLAADIGPNDTTIRLTDGSGFPTGNFYIKIDNEVMEIASRSGNTLTAKAYPSDPQPDKSGRGIATVKGSNWQATSHTSGAPVYWKHEEWFLHDRNDGSRLIYASYGWYHMDVAIPGWREEFARATLSYLDANFDGALGDDTWAHIDYCQGTARFTRVSDSTYGYIPDSKVASFHSDMAGMLADAKQRFGSKKLYFNGLHATLDPYQDYLAAADGAMNEEFLHGGTKPATWLPSYATWQEMLNRLVYTQQTAEGILCYNRYYNLTTPPPDVAQRSHLFSLATYLLGSGPTSYFAHVQADMPYMGYYAIWDAPIGTPTGPYYQANGVYQRDFTNGKVLVNPYDSGTAMTVPLGRPLRVLNFDGTLSVPVASVDLPTQTGVVLVLAPLTVGLAASPLSGPPQSLVTYTITFRNTGTEATDNVVVSGYVPENTEFVPGSVRLNGSPVSPDPVTGDGRVVVNVGSLVAGGEGQVAYQVRIR